MTIRASIHMISIFLCLALASIALGCKTAVVTAANITQPVMIGPVAKIGGGAVEPGPVKEQFNIRIADWNADAAFFLDAHVPSLYVRDLPEKADAELLTRIDSPADRIVVTEVRFGSTTFTLILVLINYINGGSSVEIAGTVYGRPGASEQAAPSATAEAGKAAAQRTPSPQDIPPQRQIDMKVTEKGEERPRLFFSILGGLITPENTPGSLEEGDGGPVLALGVGGPISLYFWWDAEFSLYDRDFRTPPGVTPPLFGTIDDRMVLFTGALTVSGRALLPYRVVRPYAGAGVGLFRSTLEITGTLFGIPGTYLEETDTGPGLFVFAGTDIMVGEKYSLAVEVRKLFLRGSFGQITNGSVDIGGDIVMVGFRRYFY